MPPASPIELLAFVLLGLSVVLVPAALAFGLYALARSDRGKRVPVPAVARRSPRRPADPPRRTNRPGRPGRRFPGR